MHAFALLPALLHRDDDGAVATEYAILITLIAGLLIALVFTIGSLMAVHFGRAAAIF